MKKIIFLLILISLAQIVLADTINKGESTYASGKTVTLVSVSENTVIVSVDEVKNIISLNDEEEINGLTIKVTSIFYFDENTGSAELLISGTEETSKPKATVCGDGECNGNEDSEKCCKDCGCKYGYGCDDNKCVKAECLKDSECYATPKDYCSLDKCDSITQKCTHKPIIDCVVNDKCCPTACYYPDDPDCPATKLNPNPTAKKETTTTTSEQGTETGETPTGEKIGFFQKIINWFLGLFKK